MKCDCHLNQRTHHPIAAILCESPSWGFCALGNFLCAISSLKWMSAWHSSRLHGSTAHYAWKGRLFPQSRPGNCPYFRAKVILFIGNSSCYVFYMKKKIKWLYKSDQVISYLWLTRSQVVLAFTVLSNGLHIYLQSVEGGDVWRVEASLVLSVCRLAY